MLNRSIPPKSRGRVYERHCIVDVGNKDSSLGEESLNKKMLQNNVPEEVMETKERIWGEQGSGVEFTKHSRKYALKVSALR